MLTSFYLCWHVYFYVCSHWKALKNGNDSSFISWSLWYCLFCTTISLWFQCLLKTLNKLNTGTNQGLREKNISYNTIMIRFIFWHVFFSKVNLNSTYQLNTKIYLSVIYQLNTKIYLNNWRVSKLSYNVLKKKTHLINIWITKTQGWMLKQAN